MVHGIPRVVALRRGRKPTRDYALFVDSDLEENVEPAIRRSPSARRDRDASLPSINNSGIEVTFCGLAVRVGRIIGPSGREIGRAFFLVLRTEERIRRIWRSLLSKPEAVKFEPYCPVPTSPELQTVGTPSQRGQKPLRKLQTILPAPPPCPVSHT